MKKKLTAMLLACLLLTGCGGNAPADPPATQTTQPTTGAEQTQPTQPTQPTKGPVPAQKPEQPQEPEELTAVRTAAAENGAMFAVAFLGYAELPTFADVGVYLEANGFGEKYPFLYDIPEEHLVRQEGGELYAVVPATQDVELSVHAYCMNYETYIPDVGEELFRLGDGQPILVMGNVSEIVPNLFVRGEREGLDPIEYVPYISLEDGSLTVVEGVYDFTPYDLVYGYDPAPDEFVSGIWYGRSTHGNGDELALTLELDYDGTARYSYGLPDSDLLEKFEGIWYGGEDGQLVLELHGGAVNWDGSESLDEPYDLMCKFVWDFQGSALVLERVGGDFLPRGRASSAPYDFMPFDAFTLAGDWAAGTVYRDWTYVLRLLDNGECWFTLYENDVELVFYEGWWNVYDDVVSLGLFHARGQHPESSEEYLWGEYRFELFGPDVMYLHYKDGSILTLDMEEYTTEDFLRQS